MRDPDRQRTSSIPRCTSAAPRLPPLAQSRPSPVCWHSSQLPRRLLRLLGGPLWWQSRCQESSSAGRWAPNSYPAGAKMTRPVRMCWRPSLPAPGSVLRKQALEAPQAPQWKQRAKSCRHKKGNVQALCTLSVLNLPYGGFRRIEPEHEFIGTLMQRSGQQAMHTSLDCLRSIKSACNNMLDEFRCSQAAGTVHQSQQACLFVVA